MNVLSLFSGVGAIDLGLQRAGMAIAGQVEINPWCRSVLARHWPGTPRHDDVTTFAPWWESEQRPDVDLIAGGFPCQPFSQAGRRLGIADSRWMWPAMAACIRLVGPRFVVVENVAALLRDADAFGRVLGDLADLGFDADWSVISACAFGAPHVRRRLFLVAYANGVNGTARLGSRQELSVAGISWRPPAVEYGRPGARAWRDRADWALAAACVDDRDTDGAATRMVEAGGNAVVVPVIEHIGQMIMAAAA